jgi:hypothetical protein
MALRRRIAAAGLVPASQNDQIGSGDGLVTSL